ncbi:MAG TPA: hypothetical protein VJV79_02865 [Polyangiaceae bacterium]|nr:hypothetical protein [Polyangiaceae bacterium]
MPAINDLQQTNANDVISVHLNGQELGFGVGDETGLAIIESYEVKLSVFQQPSAITVRLGWGGNVDALAKYAKPNSPFTFSIAGTKILTGVVYSRGVPTAQSTCLELKVRDYMARLFDDEIQDEISFNNKTYFSLTRTVLNIVGMTEQPNTFKLLADNDANRAVISRAKGKKRKPKNKSQVIEQIETGVGAGGAKIVRTTIKANVGTSYYNFLQEQYKLAGLFLWCTADANFVLARPTADQEPAYTILVREGQQLTAGRMVDRVYEDNATQRHTGYIVYGRAGTGTEGRTKLVGSYVDAEMAGYGFSHNRVIHDDDVKSQAEADYVARRACAEERRQGWKLEYTVSGHILPSTKGTNGYLIWAQDMVCRVDDDDLNIHQKFYIQDVTFRRNPHMTTTIALMRPEDLVFAEGLF